MKGKGIKEKGVDQNGKVIIECSKKYFRPSEVETLLGDSTKARRKLNWRPEIEIKALVEDMVNEDLISLSNDKKK